MWDLCWRNGTGARFLRVLPFPLPLIPPTAQRPKNNPSNGDTVVPCVHKVQGTEVIKCGVGVCAGTKMEFCSQSAWKRLYCVALLYEPKQQLVSKRGGKLSKGIFFLRDNATAHRLAIMHHELADLRFEVLKCSAYSPDLSPLDY
jgi:hypothetical protein